MNWLKANYVGFIPPGLFDDFKGLREGIVIGEKRIKVNNEHMLTIEEDVSFLPGTEVIVRFDRFFWFMSKADHEIKMIEYAEQLQQKELEKRKISIQQRCAAEAFNTLYDFPFHWEAAIKPVLSGLRQESKCNGHNKRTVYHILLISAFNSGKFKRKAGDLLCTSDGQSNGIFSDLSLGEYLYDYDGQKYKPQITCRSCLRIAKRWRKDTQ